VFELNNNIKYCVIKQNLKIEFIFEANNCYRISFQLISIHDCFPHSITDVNIALFLMAFEIKEIQILELI
jgi:hypothetical protein